MRVSILLTTACGALLAAAPAWGQAAPAQPSVESYLCTFAGKCDGAAAPEATREAPPTKGFSLARPQAAREAPSTKGFSLARPQAQKSEPAPATRGFSMAQPTRAKTVPAQPRATAARPSSARRAPAAVAAVTPAASVGAVVPAGRRADLMIAFEANSDKMTSVGEARARIFATAMLRPELLGKRFRVEGHTDSVGNRAANLDLSRRRAQSVADFLASSGVDRSRIETRGLGFSEPLTGRRASDPANRRVEAELIS